jgi:hypothetical protein
VLTWGTGNIKPQIQIAEIDEKGAGWVFVRDVAVAKGLKITVDQKKIVLT